MISPTQEELAARIVPVRYSRVREVFRRDVGYRLWRQSERPLLVRGTFKHFADGAWLSGRERTHLVAVFEQKKTHASDPDAVLFYTFIGSDYFIPPIPLWRRDAPDGTECWGGIRGGYYAYVFDTQNVPAIDSPYVLAHLHSPREYQ